MALRSAASLFVILIAIDVVANIVGGSEVTSSESKSKNDMLSQKFPVKRNVAWVARSGHRKFFFDPRADKRNVAWFAKSGGRDASVFPPNPKRDFEEPEIDLTFEPYQENDLIDYDDSDLVEKRNMASLVNSKTIPSFVTGYKRHVGSAMKFRNFAPTSVYNRPQKRFFASLLKSETPPPSLYARMNRRYSYFDPPSKRFFYNLLENDDGAPGEELEKRNIASMFNRNNPYRAGKRTFGSLLKSESGIGMPGNRYYSTLMDKDKRFVASLLKSADLKDDPQEASDELLNSIYEQPISAYEKRHFASLINRNNPYQTNRRINKRQIGNFKDMPKRFYGSVLDNSENEYPYDKRSFASLMKSSSNHRFDKKHIGSAMRYRQGKRDPNDNILNDEDFDLDAYQKHIAGALVDDALGKRHFSSLIDNRDARSGMPYDEQSYPLLEEKRHFASILDNSPSADKRFLGSLLDADTPYMANNDDKRFLGSAINSRMRFKNEGKRYLGSAINSRLNYINGAEKRSIGSSLDKQSDGEPMSNNDSPDNLESKIEESKRFIGSALKSNHGDDENRSKRSASEDDQELDVDHVGVVKRSADYFEGEPNRSWLEDGEHFTFVDIPDDIILQEIPIISYPVKRFLHY